MKKWMPHVAEEGGALHPLINRVLDFTNSVSLNQMCLWDSIDNQDILALLECALEKRDHKGLGDERVPNLEPTPQGIAQLCRIILCGDQDFCRPSDTHEEEEADNDANTTLELEGRANDSQETISYVLSSQGSAAPSDSDATVDYRVDEADSNMVTENPAETSWDNDETSSEELCPLPNSVCISQNLH